MKKTQDYGSLHELLTHQFNPDKLYQFILFPSEVNHTLSRKDNRGKDIPLTKGVYPLNFPYALEHKTLMLVDKDRKQLLDDTGKPVLYNTSEELPHILKKYKDKGAKLEPVTVRDCLGEMEILMHLQTPERDKKHIVTTKNFTQGRITLRGSDVNELKVLVCDDAFANKPNRDTKKKALFFLRDEEAYEQKQIEVEEELFAIEAYIRDLANIDAVRAYARIVLPEVEYDRISGNDLSIIRRMAALAKQNPKVYMEGFRDPAHKKLHFIKEAVSENVIRFDERQNALYFAKTGSLILQCPFGIDVERQFADNAMSESNIAAVNNYNEMMKLLRPNSNKKEVTENSSTVSAANDSTEDTELKKIIAIGVEKGVITLFGTAGGFWWLADPANKVSIMGLKPLKKKLTEDTEFKEQFYDLLK